MCSKGNGWMMTAIGKQAGSFSGHFSGTVSILVPKELHPYGFISFMSLSPLCSQHE